MAGAAQVGGFAFQPSSMRRWCFAHSLEPGQRDSPADRTAWMSLRQTTPKGHVVNGARCLNSRGRNSCECSKACTAHSNTDQIYAHTQSLTPALSTLRPLYRWHPLYSGYTNAASAERDGRRPGTTPHTKISLDVFAIAAMLIAPRSC